MGTCTPRFEYRIVGHSGDTDSIGFVDLGKAPQNQRVRLGVVEKMVAHSQFCWSGDHTLEATQRAIKEAAAVPGDEDQYVFVVSDANLRRYGIAPAALGTSHTHVLRVPRQLCVVAVTNVWCRQAARVQPTSQGVCNLHRVTVRRGRPAVRGDACGPWFCVYGHVPATISVPQHLHQSVCWQLGGVTTVHVHLCVLEGECARPQRARSARNKNRRVVFATHLRGHTNWSCRCVLRAM